MEVRGRIELPVRNNRDDGNFLREKMMSNERRLVVLSMCCSRVTAGDDDGISLMVRSKETLVVLSKIVVSLWRIVSVFRSNLDGDQRISNGTNLS